MKEKVINLLSDLIRIESITPDVKCVEFVRDLLVKKGFECDFVVFDDTANLYATVGNKSGKNLCFCGHVDVVPLVDERAWKFGGFNPVVDGGRLYGRGAVDMKGAIAAFLIALFDVIERVDLKENCVSVLITGDEEGSGENGTRKMLEYITKKGERIDFCLIGEPTCCDKSLDCVHIGRRGSFNFKTEVFGVEGHVAYKENFDNPITKAVNVCKALSDYDFCDGDELYPNSNLEIVAFDGQNAVNNVVLNRAFFRGNVRFNAHKNSVQSLGDLIGNIHKGVIDEGDFKMESVCTHGGYHSGVNEFSNFVLGVVKGFEPNVRFATHGGVTDGSFLINYCKNICELGLKDSVMHKIDEYVEIDDLMKLCEVYGAILGRFVKN
ncbi:MAG: succinyl-diaminopimelate desuccinylase [Pseudomonadota bacterium]|jgi:succinyl-diaminopimelate desuccinylase